MCKGRLLNEVWQEAGIEVEARCERGAYPVEVIHRGPTEDTARLVVCEGGMKWLQTRVEGAWTKGMRKRPPVFALYYGAGPKIKRGVKKAPLAMRLIFGPALASKGRDNYVDENDETKAFDSSG